MQVLYNDKAPDHMHDTEMHNHNRLTEHHFGQFSIQQNTNKLQAGMLLPGKQNIYQPPATILLLNFL